MPNLLPLRGIRVLDLSLFIQGPLAAMMLADWGAEVIKIEKPGRGDFARTSASIYGRSQYLQDGRNVMFETANRNKRAIALDLKTAEGREVFYRIAANADVFVTNLQTAALAEFQVDRATLAAKAPNLIYAHSTGFGAFGPNALDPCQDTAGMARSGFMMNCASSDDEPVYPTGALSDVLSGTMTAFGVVMALLARERLGCIPEVACSQMSTMMWVQSYAIAQYANTGEAFVPHAREAASNPLLNMYRCADGQWIACGMFVSERFDWREFCQVMDFPEQVQADNRFSNDEGRSAHAREFIQLMDRAFGARPRDYWVSEFRKRGYWFSIINDLKGLLADPQVVANNYMTETRSGFQTVSGPFSLSHVPQSPPRDAPSIGQDTASILHAYGGYSSAEIAALISSGIVEISDNQQFAK